MPRSETVHYVPLYALITCTLIELETKALAWAMQLRFWKLQKVLSVFAYCIAYIDIFHLDAYLAKFFVYA